MLIVSGGRDHTVPTAIAKAEYRKQSRNESVTELAEFPDRGHALTIEEVIAPCSLAAALP